MKKETIKFIFGIFIGLALACPGVYAAILFQSSQVGYDNSTSGMTATNVQDALDELITRANNMECKGQYSKSNDTSLTYQCVFDPDIATPVYYAFGDPRDENIRTDDYTEVRALGHEYVYHEELGEDTLDPALRYPGVFNVLYSDGSLGVCNALETGSDTPFCVKAYTDNLTLSFGYADKFIQSSGITWERITGQNYYCPTTAYACTTTMNVNPVGGVFTIDNKDWDTFSCTVNAEGNAFCTVSS